MYGAGAYNVTYPAVLVSYRYRNTEDREARPVFATTVLSSTKAPQTVEDLEIIRQRIMHGEGTEDGVPLYQKIGHTVLHVTPLSGGAQAVPNAMQKTEIIQKGLGVWGFGSALAMAISYVHNQSIGWSVFHGLISWIYVVYAALFN